MLNRLQLPYESINTDIYPYDSAVITTVKSFPNTTYTTDTVSVLHSTITKSSSIAGCYITDNSVHSALYISSGKFSSEIACSVHVLTCVCDVPTLYV